LKGDRADLRRQRLKADNRCVNCAERLTYDDIGHREECSACRERRAEQHLKRAAARRRANACPQCGEPAEDGYTVCIRCRARARARWSLRGYTYKRHPNGPQAATKWKDPGIRSCPICGLRGDHICLKGNATDRRPSPAEGLW
jgi:hypothetical protein